MKKKKAFTLAEVLIVIGIIGVVAALVIPITARFYSDFETKTALKSTYSDLCNVTHFLKKDNNGSLSGQFSSITNLRDQYAGYLRTTKSCNNSSTDGCWTYSWNQMNGTTLTPPTSPGLVLLNGSIVIFEDYFSSDCDSTGSNVSSRTTFPNVCSDIMIDVNGVKKPNIIGKDIYYFWVLSNTMKPWGSDADDAKAGSIAASTTCQSGEGGWGCAGKIITDED